MTAGEFDVYIGETPVGHRHHNGKQVGFKQWQYNLRFGVTETAVIFDNLRTVGCKHKPEIKATLKSAVFVHHGADGR